MQMRYLVPLIASAGAFGAISLAAPASALPDCSTVDGGTYTGTTTTECQTPGNVQINAAAPQPDYPYPWDDEFWGAPLIIAPGGGGTGGGGHGR
jgi:hypothetical protein